MNRKQKILDEVEKTLSSMDNLKNIEPNHFIFTRIKHALEIEPSNNQSARSYPRLVKHLVLILLVLINVFTILASFEKLSNRNKATYSLVEILSIDYSLNDSQISN